MTCKNCNFKILHFIRIRHNTLHTFPNLHYFYNVQRSIKCISDLHSESVNSLKKRVITASFLSWNDLTRKFSYKGQTHLSRWLDWGRLKSRCMIFFSFFFCCRFFWKAGAGRGSKRRTKREKSTMAKIEMIVFSICLVFLHPIWPLWDPFRFSSVFTYWQIFILKNVFYSWRHGFCRKFWSWSKAKRKRERNKKESRIAALKYVSRAKKVTP